MLAHLTSARALGGGLLIVILFLVIFLTFLVVGATPGMVIDAVGTSLVLLVSIGCLYYLWKS